MAAPTAPPHRPAGPQLAPHLPLSRLPASGLETQPQGLFLIWLAYAGVLLFAAWLLWKTGAWARLADADPTRLTFVIVALFAGTTAWVGRRAWVLGQQWQWLGDTGHPTAWHGAGVAHDPATRMALLGEVAHGPHEMAWWVNGALLKLGLLGKVIGFAMLAMELGQLQGFEATQAGALLSKLTGGLGIALLTTITGLSANLLLGVQLMRLDRFADTWVARALEQPGAGGHGAG